MFAVSIDTSDTVLSQLRGVSSIHEDLFPPWDVTMYLNTKYSSTTIYTKTTPENGVVSLDLTSLLWNFRSAKSRGSSISNIFYSNSKTDSTILDEKLFNIFTCPQPDSFFNPLCILLLHLDCSGLINLIKHPIIDVIKCARRGRDCFGNPFVDNTLCFLKMTL